MPKKTSETQSFLKHQWAGGKQTGGSLVGSQNLGNVTSHKNYVKIYDRTKEV